MTSDEKKLSFIKATITIANADGVIDQKEREEIERMINTLGLNEEEEREVRTYLRNPTLMGDINLNNHDREEGIMLYEFCCRVAYADGRLDLNELQVLSNIRKFFSLTPAETLIAENAAKEK